MYPPKWQRRLEQWLCFQLIQEVDQEVYLPIRDNWCNISDVVSVWGERVGWKRSAGWIRALSWKLNFMCVRMPSKKPQCSIVGKLANPVSGTTSLTRSYLWKLFALWIRHLRPSASYWCLLIYSSLSFHHYVFHFYPSHTVSTQLTN